MNDAWLLLQRDAFFTLDQLAQVEEAMLGILESIGIAVLDGDMRGRLQARGFRARGERVLIERGLVQELLAAERAANGDCFSLEPAAATDPGAPFTFSTGAYCQAVHDTETDRVVPFTAERVIEATKLLDVLSDRGLYGNVAGCPTDLPPALQPVIQYQIAATYSRHGRTPVDPKAEVTMPWVMEMAETLGHPMRALPVYVFSPLSLSGESLRCAIRFQDRLDAVHVSTMSSLGCTAPINVGDAFALVAAEAIGSAALLRELLTVDVHWGIRLCPFDMRTLSMVLGSPEDMLLQLAHNEVDAYLRGTGWSPSAAGLHTMAQLPGAQACAEKASLMTVGALLGQRHFGGAGGLSFDEVFSAEQLLYDLEIKDHTERLVRGLNTGCDPDRCLRDVEAALEQRSFVALESTLGAYRQQYWHPRLFARTFLGPWQERGSPTIRDQAQAMVRELVAGHRYELEDDLRVAMDAIVARARRTLS